MENGEWRMGDFFINRVVYFKSKRINLYEFIPPMRDNIIQIKTFEFGVRIIALHQHLHKKYDSGIAKQVLHSGTSIGANVHEAVEAQSKKDFIHKMSIALKESRETCYWLSLLKTSNISGIDFDELLVQLDEIIRILISIIKTSKFNLNKS